MTSLDKNQILAIEFELRVRLKRRLFEKTRRAALEIEETNERANELIKLIFLRYFLAANRLESEEYSCGVSARDDELAVLALIAETFETIRRVEVQAERDYLTRIFVGEIVGLSYLNQNDSELARLDVQYYIDEIQDSDERRLALESWGKSFANDRRLNSRPLNSKELLERLLNVVDQIDDQDVCEEILQAFLTSVYRLLSFQAARTSELAVSETKNVGRFFLNLADSLESPLYQIPSFAAIGDFFAAIGDSSEQKRYFERCSAALNEIDSLEKDWAIESLLSRSFISAANVGVRDVPWNFSLLEQISDQRLAAKLAIDFYRNELSGENESSDDLNAVRDDFFAFLTDLERDAEQENDPGDQIQILLALAEIGYLRGKPKAAQTTVRKILAATQRVENATERSNLFFALYRLLRRVGQTSPAKKLFELCEAETDRIEPDDFRRLQWNEMIRSSFADSVLFDETLADRLLAKVVDSPESIVWNATFDWLRLDDYLTGLFVSESDRLCPSRFSVFPDYSLNEFAAIVENVFAKIDAIDDPIDRANVWRELLEASVSIRNDLDVVADVAPK